MSKTKENTECMICCEKYNKSTRSKVVCNSTSCNFEACKTCIRHYLMDTTSDIHCMSCKKAWDQTFVVLNLNRSWCVDKYRPRRTELLFQRNISKTQEVMPQVEDYMELKRIRKRNEPKINKLREEQQKLVVEKNKIRSDMYAKQEVIRKEMYKRINEISKEFNEILMEKKDKIDDIGNNIIILQNESGIEKKERSKFVMPCQRSDCKGFLSNAYKCGLCAHYTCPKCLKVLGETKDENHVCNDDDVKSAEYIKSTTRPCPKCGERIYKTSGCNQMWCTECHCAFDWTTGKIETGTVHNPHYFQFLRENTNGGNIPRQPGDDPCADYGPYLRNCNVFVMEHVLDKDETIEFHEIEDTVNTELRKKKKTLAIWCDIIFNMIQTINHIQFVDMVQVRTRLEECQQTQQELITFITKEISESNFKSKLEEKDKQRQKYNDQLYIFDLIVNVGKDIIKSIFKHLVDNDMNMSKENLKNKIKTFTIDQIYNIYKNVRQELKRFIIYCNEQFQIVSVSHNCVVPQIKLFKSNSSMMIRGFRQPFTSNIYKIQNTKSKISDVKKNLENV